MKKSELKKLKQNINPTYSQKVGYESLEVVDLETAIKLKQIGFNEPTKFYYSLQNLTFVKTGLNEVKDNKKINHNKFTEPIYSAPTKKEVELWLSKTN